MSVTVWQCNVCQCLSVPGLAMNCPLLLSFVHTSKCSSIIPTTRFPGFVVRQFRSICKSIYSPSHAIRLSNVRHHPPPSTPPCSHYWILQRKRKPDVVWGLVVQDQTKQKWRLSEGWKEGGKALCQLGRVKNLGVQGVVHGVDEVVHGVKYEECGDVRGVREAGQEEGEG